MESLKIVYLTSTRHIFEQLTSYFLLIFFLPSLTILSAKDCPVGLKPLTALLCDVRFGHLGTEQ